MQPHTRRHSCVHFSSKVFRGNTDFLPDPGPRFPVVGLVHSFMSRDADGR
jgi:hypothetical protein